MITRILVAVDDAPASMQAARTAVELAASLGARLRVVNVLRNHLLSQALERVSGYGHVSERRDIAGAGCSARWRRSHRRPASRSRPI